MDTASLLSDIVSIEGEVRWTRHIDSYEHKTLEELAETLDSNTAAFLQIAQKGYRTLSQEQLLDRVKKLQLIGLALITAQRLLMHKLMHQLAERH